MASPKARKDLTGRWIKQKALHRNCSLSWDFVVSKVRERGVVWCLSSATRRATLPLVSLLLTPLAALLALARVRFIQGGNILTRLGHLAFEPELYVKSGLLGWHPQYHAILLAPVKRVANPCLLDYWRRYITIVSNPLLVKLLRPLATHPLLRHTITQMSTANGNIRPRSMLWVVQAKYEAEFGDRPLLTLSESDHERGWRCLQELGVPRDAWFVCLHVREGGYLPQLSYHSYRDADANTFLLASRAIAERGGWVIRVGDPTMKPLLPVEQVVDYVHTDVRSDWMDVFCLSQSRFFLGSASGPMSVAAAFGVPIAAANYGPMGCGAYTSNALWIPKLYWSIKDHRHLAFDEVLLSPLRAFGMTEEFDAAVVSLVDNSPEDIRDLAVEMMDRLNGAIHYTAEDENLQERFKTLLEAEPEFATGARVGREFLSRYRDLLK